MGEPEEYTVSEERRPPPHPFYGDSWERGDDPWHADAFRGLEIQLGGNPGNRGERKGGWFLLDGYGQEIGWVPDGAVVRALATPQEQTTQEDAP